MGVPTGIDWKLPEHIEISDIKWPQPKNVKMGPYNAYDFGEIFLIVGKVSEKASSDSDHLLSKKQVGCAAQKLVQPGFADLTLPLSISNQKKQLTKWSPWIEKSKETFAIPLEGYKTEAIKAGKRLVLNLTPIDKKQVKFTKSLQFFSADGLIHSDEKQNC